MRHLALLLFVVMTGCSAVTSAPGMIVDALLPSPPQAGREPSRPSEVLVAGKNCLSPEQAYQSSLDRRSAELPRYQPASTRNGIEVFGRAIGVIAAARYSAKQAAQTCVTRPPVQSSIAW